MYFCFLACVIRNEDEEDRAEKVEKGTKVRRKLSSLRNRMTGSFNKDRVNSTLNPSKSCRVQTNNLLPSAFKCAMSYPLKLSEPETVFFFFLFFF